MPLVREWMNHGGVEAMAEWPVPAHVDIMVKEDLQLCLEQKSPHTQASTFTDTFPLELHHFHRVL